MKRGLLVLALVGLLATPAMASRVLSTDLHYLPNPNSATTRALPYATGFEPAEGFAPGFINGQAGWSTYTTATTYGEVSTANPAAGTQHLRLGIDPASGSGAWSPNLGTLGAGLYTMDVDVCIGGTGGADYDIIPQAPSQGFLSARVKNYWSDFDGDTLPGDVLVLDDVDGSGLAYVDTGFDYVPGQYYHLNITMDSVAGSISYDFNNGAVVYNGIGVSTGGIVAGTSFEEAVFICDEWNLSEFGDFDNLVITPEPGTLLLLGIGGMVLLRRRR